MLILFIFLFLVTNVYATPARVVYKPDGTVIVLHPSPKSSLGLQGALEKMTREGHLEGLPFDDIDSSVLPSRKYRDAWEKRSGGGIKINQTKKDEIKAKRDKKIQDKQSAKDKLKALGLTDSELNEILKWLSRSLIKRERSIT